MWSVKTERTTGHFEGFDLQGFWDEHEYYTNNYTEPAPSDEVVAEIERSSVIGFLTPSSSSPAFQAAGTAAVPNDAASCANTTTPPVSRSS